MKSYKRINRTFIILSVIIYIIGVVCLFMFQPFVASAAGKLPGGVGNHVSYKMIATFKTGMNRKQIVSADLFASKDVEIVGYWTDDKEFVSLQAIRDGRLAGYSKDILSDYLYTQVFYDSSDRVNSSTMESLNTVSDASLFGMAHMNSDNGRYESFDAILTGLKVFKDKESFEAYADNGSLDGLVKDEMDSDWYLKDIRLKVTADDSPTSEAGEDATYIQFNWLTDNLQEGDLLEIKTHNYLKKIGGDQISGFHDYITWLDNVSAYEDVFTDKDGNERASYTMGQYDATKAWFSTLENKPFIFKSYDTDTYYFRPYRNGVYGRWCKVTIGRNPLLKGTPYIEHVEIGDIDDDGNWDKDEDLTDENGGDHGVDQGGNIIKPDPDNPFEGTNVSGIFKWFFDFMKEIPAFLGDLPSLVSSIIGFLPPQIIGFIAIGLVVAIILRIAGR